MNKYINAEQLKKEFPHDEDWDYPVNTNSYVVELINSTHYIDLVYCKDCIYRPLKEDPNDEPYKFNLIARPQEGVVLVSSKTAGIHGCHQMTFIALMEK